MRLIEKLKGVYMWVIRWYPMYLLVGIGLTPFVAFRLLLDDAWFYEFRYDVFKKRMKEKK